MSNSKTKAGVAPAPIATSSFAVNKELLGFAKRKKSSAESLGSLRDNLGDDFFIRPCDATFRQYARGERSTVSVEITLPDSDDVTYFTCSKQISSMLVDGDITIGHLFDLPLLRGERTNKDTGEITHPIFITVPEDSFTQTAPKHASEVGKKAPLKIANSYKAPAW